MAIKTKLGKDGLARDWKKLKLEWALMQDVMRPHWARWRRKPLDTHAYVNLFVESRRASPYLTGHVDAWMYTFLLMYVLYRLVL